MGGGGVIFFVRPVKLAVVRKFGEVITKTECLVKDPPCIYLHCRMAVDDAIEGVTDGITPLFKSKVASKVRRVNLDHQIIIVHLAHVCIITLYHISFVQNIGL